MATGNVYGDMWSNIVQGKPPVASTPRTPYSRNRSKGRGYGPPVSPKGLVPVSVRDITPGMPSGLQTVLDYKESPDAYAARARAYEEALKRNNAPKNPPAGSGGGPAGGGVSPFSSTGINIVDPQQPQASSVGPTITPPNPIDEAYNALFGQIGAVRGRNTGDLDAATAAINAAYDAAAKGNRDLFGRDANAIDEMSKALGVNFATSKQGIDIDQAARQRQEIGDLQRASNIAAVEKLRGLQSGVYDIAESSAKSAQAKAISDRSLQELAGRQAMQQLMTEIASAASGGGGGGGGGGRRGGGRKSSSGDTKFTEGAAETMYGNNIGDVAAFAALDPEARALAERYYNLGGLEPRPAIQKAQEEYDKLNAAGSGFKPTFYKNPFSGKKTNLTGGLAKKTSKQAKAGLPAIRRAIGGLTSFSGAKGTTNRDTKVTNSSTRKT